MKKFFLLSLVTTALLISCNGGDDDIANGADDDDGGNTNKALVITQIEYHEEFNNSDIYSDGFYDFSYNDNGFTSNYTYKTFGSNPDSNVDYKEVFTYNNNSQLITIESTYTSVATGTTLRKTTYTYDDAGKITKAVRDGREFAYEYGTNGYVQKMTETIIDPSLVPDIDASTFKGIYTYEYDSDDKLVKKTNHFEGVGYDENNITTIEFTYDNVKGTVSEGAPEAIKYIEPEGIQASYKVLKETYTNQSTTFVTEHSYEYDDNGNPTKQITKSGDTSTTTYLYTYGYVQVK